MTTTWHEDGLLYNAGFHRRFNHFFLASSSCFSPGRFLQGRNRIGPIYHGRYERNPVCPVKKVPALRGKTVITLFYENSTRTRLSFELAAKSLSAGCSSLSASSSSISKGESLIDTFQTLESLGADVVICVIPNLRS
jgi:hypothetical protein